jgi:hypothetical protein
MKKKRGRWFTGKLGKRAWSLQWRRERIEHAVGG